ncbi:MAG TPA: hypothetical protein V6C97_03285 [Oculatellaceae cyanobacterium]
MRALVPARALNVQACDRDVVAKLSLAPLGVSQVKEIQTPLHK